MLVTRQYGNQGEDTSKSIHLTYVFRSLLGTVRYHQCVCTQNLTKLLGDHAPGCCKEQKVEKYFGRKVAVDASMHIYQFLVGCAEVWPAR